MDWCFFLFVFSAVFSSSLMVSNGAALTTRSRAGSPKHCRMDYECGHGFYCYKVYESHICAPCVDCAGYKRLPGFRDCARSKLECGDCVPGYHQLGVGCSMVPDNFTVQDMTKEDKLEKSFHHHHTNFPWWIVTAAVAVILLVSAAITIAGCILWKKCKRHGARDSPKRASSIESGLQFQPGYHHHHPSAPPPYNEMPHDSFAAPDRFPNGRTPVLMAETTVIAIEAAQKTNPVSRPEALDDQQEQQENGEENEHDNGEGDDENNAEAMDAPAVLFQEAPDLNPNAPNDEAELNDENDHDAGVVPMDDEGWEDEQDLDIPEHSINLEDHGAIIPDFVPEADDHEHLDHHIHNIFSNNHHNNNDRDEDQSFFQLDMQFALRFVNSDEDDDRNIAVFRARNDSGLGESPLRQSYDRLVPDLDDTNAGSALFPSTSTPHQNAGQFSYQGMDATSVNSTLFRALDFLVNSFNDFSREELPMDEEVSIDLG